MTGGTDPQPSAGTALPRLSLYALAMRERCAPVECTKAVKCWVANGGSKTLQRSQGAPRCGACEGVIREGNWQTPMTWELTLPKIID